MPYWQDGKKGLSANFCGIWQDFSGQLRRLPLLADRKSSQELANKIDKLNSLRASGDLLPPDLSRYVETMPPKIREKLGEWDILPASRVTASKPLPRHLDDWKRSLLAKGNTPRHAELVTRRAGKIFGACGFRFWTDITASRVEAKLADMRQDRTVERKVPDGTTERQVTRGIGPQTFNFYLQAAKQFCRWMVRDDRGQPVPAGPLAGAESE